MKQLLCGSCVKFRVGRKQSGTAVTYYCRSCRASSTFDVKHESDPRVEAMLLGCRHERESERKAS